MPTVNDVVNAEVLEVGIQGPDGATRMYVCTGRAEFRMEVREGSTTQTWRFLVGPELTRRQFIRATAMVSISNFNLVAPSSGRGNHFWDIKFTDADWDDESGQVEVSAELEVYGADDATTMIRGLIYHVTIIAEVS